MRLPPETHFPRLIAVYRLLKRLLTLKKPRVGCTAVRNVLLRAGECERREFVDCADGSTWRQLARGRVKGWPLGIQRQRNSKFL